MKRTLALFVSILCFGLTAAYSQQIHSTMFVDVVDADPADSLGGTFYPYKLKITQDFDVSSLQKDTVQLKLENTSFIQSVKEPGYQKFALIPNMQVRAKSAEGEYQDAVYSFDGVSIIVPKNNYTQVRVEYGYYSDLFF